jgi:hypothetical protein
LTDVFSLVTLLHGAGEGIGGGRDARDLGAVSSFGEEGELCGDTAADDDETEDED